MNIWKWLTTRVLRLPKANNSVSDIIGESNWDAIKTTLTTLIQSAISKELLGLESVAMVSADEVVMAVLGVFKGNNPAFSLAIQASINASIKASMNKTITQLQDTIISDLTKVIGLV